MNSKIKKIAAYSLMELLIVLAIFIILASFGTGGLIGFRETMFVKENVEKLKQDIELARQKSLLIDRDADDTWVYGIGIDFRNIGDGTYSMFKWCSPYENFGNDVTRSELLGWDPDYNVGDFLPSVDGIQEINLPRSQFTSLPTNELDPVDVTDELPTWENPGDIDKYDSEINAYLPISNVTTSCIEGTN